MKSQLTGGKIGDNPLITGLLGVYNNTMLVEDARVPCVAIDGDELAPTTAAASSAARRRQPWPSADGKSDTNMSWVEELFDYSNQLGVGRPDLGV
jgi:hypothetical protein